VYAAVVGLAGSAAAVPAAAVVVAERLARGQGLERAAAHLTAQLGTERPVRLAVPERPLLPALLAGRATAQVEAEGVPVGDGAQLEQLSVRLDPVRLRLRDTTLHTGAGVFEASVAERELGDLVRLPGVVSRLELRADGLRVWTVFGVALDAEVLVHDGALRVLPDPAQMARLFARPGLAGLRRAVDGLGLLLPLPPLPFGAVVETLTFDTGRAHVTGRIAPQVLPLRGGGADEASFCRDERLTGRAAD
jgi:hypothetical protein